MLQGLSFIGSQRGKEGGATFQGHNAANDTPLEPVYHSALPEEIEQAVNLAHEARFSYARCTGVEKAHFLRQIATNIEAVADELVATMPQETALPPARVRGEMGRTCNQLRMFADLVEAGSWVEAHIDRGNPGRTPVPKPDLRSMLHPIGPVVVFGASNFPLAYSTAGGDTASALAAGCPVIVKAHPAHPATAEWVAGAIQQAVAECGLPEGVFSMVYDAGFSAGQRLVQHPLVKAVGFTGSLRGGRALMDLAAQRPEPIPVYAEMGSINPIFVLPGAMQTRTSAISEGLQTSVRLGVGQFCTNPGLVVAQAGEPLATFVQNLTTHLRGHAPEAMLTSNIAAAFETNTNRLAEHPQTQALLDPETGADHTAVPHVFTTTAQAFLNDHVLHEEVFGPSTMIVSHTDRAELLAVAHALEGQLTALIHGTEADLAEAQDLVEVLTTKVGRLIFNGFPTGVEVCAAMVHGGPYPATSEGRATAVGLRAITRFARLMAYQDFPQSALPAALQDGNPLKIRRFEDGSWIQ